MNLENYILRDYALKNKNLTIQNTFDSIRNQTYNSIELIVIDGGSKDGTLEIIEANKDIISKMISGYLGAFGG